MVNDTTTLNGALSELGETLAANITTKGVTASASDGLTTLAGKVLQISGGSPTPTPTTLFEDACNSASGLSNYGSGIAIRGSGSSMSMEYDSNQNAYKIYGSGNYYSMIPIPILNDEDEYVISADVKGQSVSANAVGLCIDNRNDTTSYSYAVWLESLSKVVGKQFSLNSDGAVNQHTGLSLSANNWYRMELTVDGSSLTGKLYDGDTVLATDSTTLTVENRQVGIFLLTQNGTTNSTCYVKNIKAESLGGGSDCSAYTTQIANAIEYINGSGS